MVGCGGHGAVSMESKGRSIAMGGRLHYAVPHQPIPSDVEGIRIAGLVFQLQERTRVYIRKETGCIERLLNAFLHSSCILLVR